MTSYILSKLKNINKPASTIRIALLHLVLLGMWIFVHTAIIFFGSNNLPLHSAYIGDEQSPVNGALHVLNDRSLGSLHNLETLYYGPIFALLAIPGVLMDALIFFLTEGSVNSHAYQANLLYDWGGIIIWIRSIALIFSYLGLVALYKILTTKTVNPEQSKKFAFFGVVLLAANFYFFSYGGMFKHWIFIITPFLWQIYILILQAEDQTYRSRHNIYHALLGVFAFGVSHIAILTQALLVPYFIRCLLKKDSIVLFFKHYFIPYLAGFLLIIWWHPFAFFRYFEMFSGGVAKVNSENFNLLGEVAPVNAFSYYSEVLLFNHIFIIIPLLLLAVSIKKMSDTSLREIIIGVALVGTLYMILFSNFDVIVVRYTLFPVVSIIVICSVLAVNQWTVLSKSKKLLIGFLLFTYVIYHVVSIVGWSSYLSKGPADRKIIPEIITLSNNSKQDIYIQGEVLFGWPHSTTSLAVFATLTARTDSSLYKAYSISKPTEINVLDVTYLGNKKAPQNGFLVTCNDPIKSGALDPDYPEVRLYRLWSGDYIWNVQCFIAES